MRVRFCLLTCLNRYHDRAMSFMKKNTLSILKICQSLFGGAKKGKGPFIYYVSTLLYFWTPISPMYVGIFIALKVSKKRHFLPPPPLPWKKHLFITQKVLSTSFYNAVVCREKKSNTNKLDTSIPESRVTLKVLT